MEKTLEQKPSDCLKIVLYGPESTGKTTLAKSLAEHFNTRYVPEYMRKYLQKKWDEQGKACEVKDLLPIAEGQMKEENSIASETGKILFCDTNLLEIKTYSEYYYHGFCPEAITRAALQNHYDLYLLTDVDIPWVKDDLRDRSAEREEMFCIFEGELKRNKLPYQVLSGSYPQRLKKAIQITEKLLRA